MDTSVMSTGVAVQGLGVTYATRGSSLVALAGIDLSVMTGEFVSILGPSGCGKSTLLRVIGGLQAADEGLVRINGETPRRIQAAKQIGFVFQDPTLLPWRTVHQNIDLPRQIHGQGAADRTDDLLELTGLGGFAGYYPHQLSGGM